MKLIVKLHPEIAIKSKSVRKRFTRLLENNIRLSLRPIDENVVVKNLWDKLEVQSQVEDEQIKAELIDQLKRVPGIIQFLEVSGFKFETFDDIYQPVFAAYKDELQGKSFCVKVKRSGEHDFTSVDVARYVGGGLNQNVEGASVKLKNPEKVIHLEIKNDNAYIVTAIHQGMGGFPLPTQDDVLSLISGGFDSGVASYLMIRKGSRTHYCFFNLGGAAHEIGVKQVSHYLWSKFSKTHKVKFVSVDFEPVVAEILENVENGQMGVVLKRMMMRAASMVAEKMGVKAIVTGESIGQVSSQTIANLSVIDRVTPTLIIRPLIHHDKQDIIDIARDIGTEDFAKTMPEYCGVISKNPTVSAKLERIEQEETNFDFSILERVVQEADVKDIRDIAKEAETELPEVETVSEIPEGTVIIDVRAPQEEEESPLELDDIEVACIPFFKVASKFPDLDQSKNYLLYCDRGVMSKLQALLLKEQGYSNVNIFQPAKK